MDGYQAVADRQLEIDDVELRRREAETTSDFTRVTTEVVLRGPDHVGRGEDVTYEAAHHDALLDGGLPDLTGEYAFDQFSAHVGEVDLFPGDAPEREAFRHYRRWAVESAALDLALRRDGETLATALGGQYDPLSFVASTGLGDPPTLDRLRRLLADDPDLEFKVDLGTAWDEDLLSELAATGAVRTVDCKAHYEGADVEGVADPARYEQVLDALPGTVLEDPAVTVETEQVLAGHWSRVAWDAPVHDVADLESLPDAGWLNVKPSRFGSVESLLAAFEHCAEVGIDVYVGGQFELGPGREHLHAIASLFCPGAPNDVAPPAYNDPTYDGPLPGSPLSVPDDPVGLGWSD